MNCFFHLMIEESTRANVVQYFFQLRIIVHLQLGYGLLMFP